MWLAPPVRAQSIRQGRESSTGSSRSRQWPDRPGSPREVRAGIDLRKAGATAGFSCEHRGFGQVGGQSLFCYLNQNDSMKTAFTLIELLVVIAIVAVLA